MGQLYQRLRKARADNRTVQGANNDLHANNRRLRGHLSAAHQANAAAGKERKNADEQD